MKQNDKTQKRNVNIIIDTTGNQIVLMNTILFKGKQNVNREDVERHLKQYVGESCVVVETKETVYISPQNRLALFMKENVCYNITEYNISYLFAI